MKTLLFFSLIYFIYAAFYDGLYKKINIIFLAVFILLEILFVYFIIPEYFIFCLCGAVFSYGCVAFVFFLTKGKIGEGDIYFSFSAGFLCALKGSVIMLFTGCVVGLFYLTVFKRNKAAFIPFLVLSWCICLISGKTVFTK